MKVPFRLSPRVLAIASVICFLLFVFSASRSFAATTVHVKVGGVFGSPLAEGGMVWFNGYDPATIVIQPGDTVTWDVKGGIHTVTSTAMSNATAFVFDSSRQFPVGAALADMAPGRLLAPGSVYDLDTGTLAVGTYTYHCKIHLGMVGHLTITPTVSISPQIVNVVAGWGDHLYAVQAFAPENLTVEQGTLVRWTLMNPMEPHTITGVSAAGTPSWDSSPDFVEGPPPPVLLPGQSFSHQFNETGTFTYFCKLHAYKIGESWVGMVGTVHVVPLGVVEAAAGISAVSYAALGIGLIALLISIVGMVRGGRGAKPGP